MADEPIIVKKIIKKGHAHHGGAWKLAYADFVTAMMAFFLLMWLLGTTDEVTKKGISEYFQDPYEASRIDKGLVPTLDELDPTELDKQSEQEDKVKLEMLRLKIEKMLDENKKLEEIKEQIQLILTPEGLRVQIVDGKKAPMFKLGSADADPKIRTILQAMAPVIQQFSVWQWRLWERGHLARTPRPPALLSARVRPVFRGGSSLWQASGHRHTQRGLVGLRRRGAGGTPALPGAPN